eukprot:g6537.t1
MSVTLRTNVGDLKVELHCGKVPKPCKNFLALCASGHSNSGDIFERENGKGGLSVCGRVCVSGAAPAVGARPFPALSFLLFTLALAVCGDIEKKNGKGGRSIFGLVAAAAAAAGTTAAAAQSSETTASEDLNFFDHEPKPDLRHDRRGVLAFADTGKVKKIGSQFYLTYKRLPNLDGNYTVIGRLIDGFETLQKMEDSPVVDEKKYRPVKDIVIEEVLIHANPIAEEEGG